jgi:hypothetical protein
MTSRRNHGFFVLKTCIGAAIYFKSIPEIKEKLPDTSQTETQPNRIQNSYLLMVTRLRIPSNQ